MTSVRQMTYKPLARQDAEVPRPQQPQQQQRTACSGPTADDERVAMAGVSQEEEPAVAGTGATAGIDGAETKTIEQQPGVSCCKRCTYWLENRRVRGLRLPAFLGLLGSLVLPEMDAVSDWLVTVEFYKGGDLGWFEASLTILLVSGVFATLLLGLLFSAGASAGATQCCQSISERSCGWLVLGLLALPFGLFGLAPVVVAALTLHRGSEASDDLKDGTLMKGFKALELVFEALPQSILQAYVSIAYGRLNPSDREHFSRLLCFSISISLLGAGVTSFNFEMAGRNEFTEVVRTGSGYGVSTILLRVCQMAMLVFWNALMACAQKGYAIYAVVASLIMYLCVGIEAAFGRVRGQVESRTNQGCCERAVTGAGTVCGLGRRTLPRAFLWNGLLVLIAGIIARTFWTVEHYDNNFANSSAPVGPPGSPQHFDCRERTSGIYPAVFFTAMSLALTPLSLGMDPVWGVGWLRGKSLRRTWKEQYDKDVLVVLQQALFRTGVLSGAMDMASSKTASAAAQAAYDRGRRLDAFAGGCEAVLAGHVGSVNSASFSSDGQRIVTASDDRTARVWNAVTGECEDTFAVHTHAVRSACFSSDDQRIVTASDDQTARVWNAVTGECETALVGHTHAVSSASFSLDNQRIVSASDDQTARVWNAVTGGCEAVLTGHAGSVNSASFSLDNQRIVTASNDNTARVWNAVTGECEAVLTGHAGSVNSASFSSHGQRIVTASNDNTARVWNAVTGECEATLLVDHTNAVTRSAVVWFRPSASFSSDGQRVLTAGGGDNAARVWAVCASDCEATLTGHAASVRSASFSSDSRRIVTASDDQTARVYNIIHADAQQLSDALDQIGVQPPPDLTKSRQLLAECARAVRQEKVNAVWRWADPMGKGMLGQEELDRIAEAIQPPRDKDELCKMLGVAVPDDWQHLAIPKAKLEVAECAAWQQLVEVLFEQQMLRVVVPEARCLDFLCAF